MKSKPKHLAPKYGAQFKDQSIVTAYRRRPPYPDETFDILTGLIASEPKRVLDVGCGTGYLARPLSQRVDAVDAVDISANMIAQGKRMPGGNAPNLRWIEGSVEEAALSPPYGLVTAGESLHWLDWSVVLPRFRDLLVADGVLAIYVESCFSRNGFSRERMGEERALAFETAVTHLVQSYQSEEIVEIQVSGHVVWGQPKGVN